MKAFYAGMLAALLISAILLPSMSCIQHFRTVNNTAHAKDDLGEQTMECHTSAGEPYFLSGHAYHMTGDGWLVMTKDGPVTTGNTCWIKGKANDAR